MRKDKSKIAVNTYNKIADVYTKEYFNDLSDTPYLDKFLNLLPKGEKVLDVGSGPGQFSKYMKERGYDVRGVDFSDEMLKIAKEKVKNVEFLKMDMRELTFNEETFDGLLVSYSLIHIPSKEIPQTLKGFCKVLKKDGIIEVIAQKGESDKIIDEPFMPSEKMFINFFTSKRISNFLGNAGFNVIFQEEADTDDPNAIGSKIIYTIARRVG